MLSNFDTSPIGFCPAKWRRLVRSHLAHSMASSKIGAPQEAVIHGACVLIVSRDCYRRVDAHGLVYWEPGTGKSNVARVPLRARRKP
jgi:hypothetical protein